MIVTVVRPLIRCVRGGVVQDEVVAAVIPRRWAGSSGPATAAAAASLEHHSRPSVRGTTPDIAMGSPAGGGGTLLQVDSGF